MEMEQHAQVYNEIEDVKQVLERADEYGLSAEVMWSALLFARQGHTTQTALEYALKEWDL